MIVCFTRETLAALTDAAIALPPEPLRLASPPLPPGRERLLHLVIGTPDGVRAVVNTLHQLRYAEQGHWTPPFVLPETGLTITPEQGEVFSLLRRDRPRS